MPLKSPLPLLLLSLLSLSLAQPTLKLVIELFRHGGRGPGDGTYDPTWTENTYGELTPDGMRQHFYLGTQMLARYPSILGQPYDPAKIYVRSTDVNRTIMSVQSQLTGIYLGTGPNLPADLPQGVDTPPYHFNASILTNLTNAALPLNHFLPPIHVLNVPEEFVLLGFDSDVCPLADQYSKEYGRKSDIYQNVSQAFQPLLANLSTIYGSNVTLDDGDDIGDTLICDYYQRKAPPNFTAAPLSYMWNQTTFMFYFVETCMSYQSTFQKQLYSTPMFGYIVDTMNGVINGSSSLEFVFLSAHDTTLLVVLTSLNYTTSECLWSNFQNNITNEGCNYPIFASNILFELWQNGSSWYVNIIYNGISMYETDPTSGYQMSFAGFQSLVVNATGNLTMSQYMSYCGLTPSSPGEGDIQYAVYAMLGVTAGLFLALMGTLERFVRLRKLNSKQ